MNLHHRIFATMNDKLYFSSLKGRLSLFYVIWFPSMQARNKKCTLFFVRIFECLNILLLCLLLGLGGGAEGGGIGERRFGGKGGNSLNKNNLGII